MVSVSGGALAYHRTGGRKPPLVLSHGLTDNGLCWRRLAEALEAEFDVVMLDARGHGGSSRVAGPHDPAADIAEAIKGLGLGPSILMGHSVGGRATAACANANSTGLVKVILEDPAFVPLSTAEQREERDLRFRAQVERFKVMTEAEILALGQSTSPSWHPDDLSDWARAKHQVDPGAMPAYATPWQAQVDRIGAPTLLIHGDPDRGSLITPAIAAEAMSLNAHIRAVRVSGAGHNVRRENFPDYLAAVLAFLGED